MLYPSLLESCRGFRIWAITQEQKPGILLAKCFALPRSKVEGEAFGYKNLGQAAKLIVRMLRPYSLWDLWVKEALQGLGESPSQE